MAQLLATLSSLALLCSLSIPLAMTQNIPHSSTVLFWEEGFPSADLPQVSRAQLTKNFEGLDVVGSAELGVRLPTAKLLVLPFGSAFPESQWSAIRQFLERGGNLVVLGGRPFTRPAFRESNGRWQLRSETQAFARELRIYGYQATEGKSQAFATNDEIPGSVLPNFTWQRAWSVIVRLSETAINDREGAAGSLDAVLRPLAWGMRDRRKLSTPAIEIDHIQHAFVGGRWEFLTCDPGQNFWDSPAAKSVIRTLVDRAAAGASDFRIQPQYAVFAGGEPWRFELHWVQPGSGPRPLRIELTIESATAKPHTERLEFNPTQLPFEIGFQLKPNPKATGLQRITARLFEDGQLAAIHHSGFWMRDDAALRSGAVISIDSDGFFVDDKPTPLVGTTYMSSDVQRQYFDYPNPYVWDRDMEQISAAGLNILRTGWWSGWDRLIENGVATEKSLRALEAYLLTARKYKLPVQFNFYAFTPELFGGRNPYLDPTSIASQQNVIRSVVQRFHDVPYLMWDLINEPSFSNPRRTWMTRPNGDEFELRAWNSWLKKKYGGHAQVAVAWHTTPLPESDLIPFPSDADFLGRGTLGGASPARAYDYHLFAQEAFAGWGAAMRDAIRATGSKQLTTVGQDEGGVTTRPSNAFFATSVDFTTNHTWWLNDALLWDSLAAKQPGLPLLIQETGVQHQSNLDTSPRLSEEEEAHLVERKVAIALGTSAGAIQWLWNTNSYMMPEMELTIGALRPDGTERAEAEVLRRFASFARDSAGVLRNPVQPEIVVVTPQTMQFSPFADQAISAQQRAVRVLNYDLHLSASVLAENQLDKLGSPKLVILPSAQALTQARWERLTMYARKGGTVLVTGPVERDEHWFRLPRISALSPDAKPEPLLSHYSDLQFGAERIPLTFDATAQQQLERLSLPQIVVDLPLGTGHIYVTADPIELAESPEPTARLYRQIAAVVGLKPAFELKTETSGALIRATEWKDAMLYLFVSESTHDQAIDITDRATGAQLSFNLAAGRARLAIIRKSDHSIIWSPE